MRGETYRDFDATELFCPHCKRSMPVRKRLLLILPEGDKYDYTCAVCGASVGDKLVQTKKVTTQVFSLNN
jgi:hypothetical protein